jgi:hypothetical protein
MSGTVGSPFELIFPATRDGLSRRRRLPRQRSRASSSPRCEVVAKFQLRAQYFSFPFEMIGLPAAPKPSDGRGRALTSADAILLGDRCQDRQQAAAIEILFGERTPFDAHGRQPFEMVECCRNAFPRRSVQPPEQNQVELALPRGGEHALEMWPLRGASVPSSTELDPLAMSLAPVVCTDFWCKVRLSRYLLRAS